MKMLTIVGLLLATSAGAVLIIDPDDRDPNPNQPTVSAVRYDADCFDVSVFVDGVQVITKSRGAAQFCADRVILLSECPVFADQFEAPPTL